MPCRCLVGACYHPRFNTLPDDECMRGPGLILAALALVLAAASAAFAADNGSISGTVFDRDGQPVVGATVRISSDRSPSPRVVLTGTNGFYQFDYLIPGDYTIEIEQTGIAPARRLAIVEVGKDTQVDVVLGLALAESVTVTAVAPVVDVRSTEVGFNFTAETLNSLPIERTFRGLFQMVPGVADNRSRVGPAGVQRVCRSADRLRAHGRHAFGCGGPAAVRDGRRHQQRRPDQRVEHAEYPRRAIGLLQGVLRCLTVVRPAPGKLSAGLRGVPAPARRD